MPPRGPTAYFIFAGEVREAIHKEIGDANDGKASVALVGKAIGVRWGQLTDEEKQHYKDLAAERTAALKEQQQQEAADGDGEEAEGEDAEKPTGGGAPLLPFGLPLSLVKKIAFMDSDVDRMGGEALKAISKAATLFIELVATKAYTHAGQFKRKNFKFSDIEAVAKKDRRMLDMGLSQLIEEDVAFSEVHEKLEAENQNRHANKNKKAAEAEAAETTEGGKPAKKMRPLTEFFGGVQN